MAKTRINNPLTLQQAVNILNCNNESSKSKSYDIGDVLDLGFEGLLDLFICTTKPMRATSNGSFTELDLCLTKINETELNPNRRPVYIQISMDEILKIKNLHECNVQSTKNLLLQNIGHYNSNRIKWQRFNNNAYYPCNALICERINQEYDLLNPWYYVFATESIEENSNIKEKAELSKLMVFEFDLDAYIQKNISHSENIKTTSIEKSIPDLKIPINFFSHAKRRYLLNVVNRIHNAFLKKKGVEIQENKDLLYESYSYEQLLIVFKKQMTEDLNIQLDDKDFFSNMQTQLESYMKLPKTSTLKKYKQEIIDFKI